ncbi:MAG: DM13 domain-containing protein [Bacteroidia bacterium]|nr:DM13 domain-containing protein [Bacteroidia bacterium]
MNRMKYVWMMSLVALVMFSACTEEVIIDSSLPQGTFSVARSGSFVEQNSTGSTGMAQLGTDEDGVQFVKFGTSFSTNFATGTVTVYLSKSQTYMADPANGNPSLRLVGITQKGGEQYFKVDPAVGSEFTHVILWCASAGVPFGYAPLN